MIVKQRRWADVISCQGSGEAGSLYKDQVR